MATAFIIMPHRAVTRMPALTGADLHVLMCLCSYQTWRNPVCWPAQATIQSVTGLSRTQVKASIDTLEREKFIKIRREMAGGRVQRTIYTVLYDDEEEVSMGHSPDPSMGHPGDPYGSLSGPLMGHPSDPDLDKRTRPSREEKNKDMPPLVWFTSLGGFPAFYTAYPNRTARQAAAKAWERLAPGVELGLVILTGVERWRTSERWQEGYVCDPSTFLNQRRWEDDIPPPKPRLRNASEFPKSDPSIWQGKH